MQSYTVHPDIEYGAEQAAFVPDGFSVTAFAFGMGWLIYHRLWLALCGALMVVAMLAGLGFGLGLNPLALSGLSMLLNLALGFEGNQIRRWTLERNGQPATAIIAAKNLDEAEIRYFTGIAARPGGPAPVEAAHVLPASFGPATGVLGMFPEPGGRS